MAENNTGRVSTSMSRSAAFCCSAKLRTVPEQFDIVNRASWKLRDALPILLVRQAIVGPVPAVEFDRELAHRFIAPLLDIGEGSLDYGANLCVIFGYLGRIASLLEPACHSVLPASSLSLIGAGHFRKPSVAENDAATYALSTRANSPSHMQIGLTLRLGASTLLLRCP